MDLRPTKEFPVDPANEAGFDNSAESLAMSPALVKKYLEAARSVADHLVLTPDGLDFAPHPMLADTDRDKYCVKRIIDFYKRQKTDYADYFLAAWRHKHRSALGQPDRTLDGLADAIGAQPQVPGDDLVHAHRAARGGRADRRAAGDLGRAAATRGRARLPGCAARASGCATSWSSCGVSSSPRSRT